MKSIRVTRIKFFVLSVICTSILLAVPAYLIYSNTHNLIIEDLRKNAMDIASVTAAFIEQDIDRYAALSAVNDYKKDEYDKEYYQKMLAVFQRLKNDTHVSYIFTEKKITDTQIAYILDGEDPESDYFSPIGSLDSMSENELKAFDEGRIISTGLIHDEFWGDYVTGFAPIMNMETGEVIGVAGVDYSYDFISNTASKIRLLVIYSFLTLMILISFAIEKLWAEKSLSKSKDFLTGLYSKNYHQSKLQKYIKAANKSGAPLSIMLMDVDYFKEINDTYGHMVGDDVLKIIAELILMDVRKADTCSRFGGDEFVVVLPDASKSNAAQVGERIRTRISNFNYKVEESGRLQLSVSIGIAQLEKDMTPEQLLDCADSAMYKSKNSGKNRVSIYED